MANRRIFDCHGLVFIFGLLFFNVKGCGEMMSLYLIILFAVAIGLFYLAYRLLRAEKDVALEILRYIFVIILSYLAVCAIIAALGLVIPTDRGMANFF